MPQVMTVLEATVPETHWERLRAGYSALVSKQFPPGLEETFLVQDAGHPETWRIVTVWESPEVLEAMRAAGTPGGVLVFRGVGVEPELAVHKVVFRRMDSDRDPPNPGIEQTA